MSHTTRAALYMRVSTQGDRQKPENQIRPMREFARENHLRIVEEYIDQESGASPYRPAFRHMMEDAKRRRFDVVIAWSLDRFSREGIRQTFDHLSRLRDAGVSFMSVTETYFRETGPAADLFIAVIAWVADFERRRKRERIAAGLLRAKAEGKTLGRPARAFPPATIAEWRKLSKQGISTRQIARRFKTSHATVARRLSE
jgi:DNA invertase Pin-like site-specific DNA recombinase